MSYELQRIAADIIIAKLNNSPHYAADKTAPEIADDYQTIYNQVKYSHPSASASEIGQKYDY